MTYFRQKSERLIFRKLTEDDVERGDALLPWKHERYMIRYVHQVDEDEFQQIANDVGLTFVEQFRSDGKEGNLSLYVVLKNDR